MKLELNTFPILDWDLSMRLAGYDANLADDMLTMLMNSLPNDLVEIKAAFNARNYADMQRHVHKLHGAVSYVGTPRLKELLAYTETQLKANQTDELATLLQRFEEQIALLAKETEARVS